MLIVRKNLFEKFVEDSDPIDDMGIGKKILIKRDFDTIYDYYDWLLKSYSSTKTYLQKILGIQNPNWKPSDIVFIHQHLYLNATYILEGFYATMLEQYTKEYITINRGKFNDMYFAKYIINSETLNPNSQTKSEDDIVKESLLEKFVEDSDPIDDMGIGMRHQISQWMKEIGQNDTDDNALTEAAKYGKLDFVKYLVQNGANIHAEDDAALRRASSNGHLEVVKYLVQNGANIHAWDDYALQWASENGHLEVIKYLVQNGANIHAFNDYALRWASSNGHLEAVKFLVQNGANIHADNDWALRWASNNGHLEVVKYLESQMKKDKIVKESLFEKFVEDSDPIADMGIGGDEWKFKNLKTGDILRIKRPILYYGDGGFLIITQDIEKRPEGDKYSHALYYYYVSTKLGLKNFAKQFNRPEILNPLGKSWSMNFKFYKDTFEKMPYTLNDIVKNPKMLFEKFVEDSDPIEDMGIGVKHVFNNIKAGDIFKIKKDLHRVQINKDSYIKIIEVFDIEKNKKIIFQYDLFDNLEELKQNNNKEGFIHTWQVSFEFFKDNFEKINRSIIYETKKIKQLIEVKPKRYVYHKSNPIFREKILREGLIPQGKSEAWLSDTKIKGKVIFVTNSENEKDWFYSTYDDDIYRIDTTKINNKWYKDINFGLDNHNYMYTFQPIPLNALELIYKGTGESFE